jgi:hypothetical protein
VLAISALIVANNAKPQSGKFRALGRKGKIMSFLSNYNEIALEPYLRGEHGELMRREAEEVIWERGRKSVKLSQFTENEMAEYLRQRGWVCFQRSA